VLATSEAFATTFLPHTTRGGASVPARVISEQNAANGEIVHNGEKQPQNYPQKANGVHHNNNGHNTNDANNFQLNAILKDELVDVSYVAETKLPTELGHFRLRAYRLNAKPSNPFSGTEPCVIYHEDYPPFGKDGTLAEGVPLRVHDQCVTSEVFGSQRCDCKDQLRMALAYIRKHGGAIIYLQQEGRGIGLANKVAAYALQDSGLDTVDANIHLGFPDDARVYGVIPSILNEMGIGSIRLLTNNPRKVERLGSLGVNIHDRVPMVVTRANRYNRKYLETKQDRMNHQDFREMLSQDIENAVMIPRISVREEFVKTGEEITNEAVQISLTTTSLEELEEDEPSGVTAREDGYCFGRQSVEDAIAAMARGEMVVVVDDMDRENEGDLIMAADACTPEDMAKIVRYSSGVVCIGMEGKRMDELKLPAMVINNEDPKGTAFSVTVDGSKERGITTGISAKDRATTVQLLANPEATSIDFARPGHIFPLRARAGGVLTRDGHTEAAVDMSRLAGFSPCGVLCEIVSEENPTEMARLPELIRFCERHGMVLTSIVDLQQYRRDTEGEDGSVQ